MKGDEVGGLTFTGSDDNGRRASSGLMFDQLKQDQTIGITYDESSGQRRAALRVWDRSDQPLSGLIAIDFLDADGKIVQRIPSK